MGEKSKKIGEIGENIVENFFPLLGWDTSLRGQDIKCLKPRKHPLKSSKSGERNEHGIDFLYCYKSPLEGSTAESAVISVKHSEKPYKTNPKDTFKSHLTGLAHTLECYKSSGLKKSQHELLGQVKKSRDAGVLFWLSSAEETYDDVVQKISNSRVDPELSFESIHVIDNRRIQFIYKTIEYLRTRAKDRTLNFYYPETSLNYVDKSIERSGPICPIDFLTAPLLPLIIKADHEKEQDVFCLSCIDGFDQDSMRRLIQAAREYTQEMSCTYLFIFPNYVPSHHKDEVIKATTGFDHGLASKIKVENYNTDFRNLNNA